MIARKNIIIFSIIFSFVLLILIFPYNKDLPQHFITEVNQAMKLSIPYNDIICFEMSSGFHGDGDTILILRLTDQTNKCFQNNLDNKWIKLNRKSEIYNYLWDSETRPGTKAVGGMLNEKISPESDTVFILLDYTTMKINEHIDFSDITDFYFVSYSYEKGAIYIQKTNL